MTWYDRSTDIPEDLWRACFKPPAEGLFWFRSLEAGNMTGQFTFIYGVLQWHGKPVGIAPAFLFDLPLDIVMPPAIARFVMPLARGPLRRFAHQRTLFVGNVAGEEGRVGMAPGNSLATFAGFIHQAMRAKARELDAGMLVWKEFAACDHPALDPLVGRRTFRMESYPSTVIALVRGGYASFLATLRSDRRWKINDKLRRGARKVAVATSVVVRPDEDELREIFALFWQTYTRGETKFERLTPEFFAAIAACDESTFIVQRDPATGKMLSFMLLLDLGPRIINQFIGIDYTAAAGGFLYFRLFAAAYDWACTTRAEFMQSGQTGYMAKLDMGHTLVPLSNYCEHRISLVNWIYRRTAATITWETLDDQLGEYLKAHPEARPDA